MLREEGCGLLVDCSKMSSSVFDMSHRQRHPGANISSSLSKMSILDVNTRNRYITN